MPAYRGVAQADLIRSIHDALALLETHSTGPEMQKSIDALRTPDAAGNSKLGAVAAASDDLGLAAAMRLSGADGLFSTVSEILQYHAVNDTGGKGIDVLQRLVNWNATGAAMFAVYTPINEEMDVWLALNYARQVDMTEENLEKLAMVTDAVSQNKVAVGTAFNATAKLVEMAHTGMSDADMKKVFLDLDLHERHILKTSITALFTLDGAQGTMVFQPAIRGYGVVVDDLTSGKVKWGDASVRDLAMQVAQALDRFQALDEVGMIAIGGINHKPGGPQGVMFTASSRAAQAVADAFPALKVIDFDGNAVPPRKKPPAPKPGFSL